MIRNTLLIAFTLSTLVSQAHAGSRFSSKSPDMDEIQEHLTRDSKSYVVETLQELNDLGHCLKGADEMECDTNSYSAVCQINFQTEQDGRLYDLELNQDTSTRIQYEGAYTVFTLGMSNVYRRVVGKNNAKASLQEKIELMREILPACQE